MPAAPQARVMLFGVAIDPLDMGGAVASMLVWIDQPRLDRCRFVVTPNVDHTVILQHNQGLRDAYRDADLVLADGFPLVVASRLLGKPLPQRVAGSELVPALFHAAASIPRPLRIFLLGARPGVAQRAAARVVACWPHIEVVGTDSPPLGFEHDPTESARILDCIRDAAPDVLVVGFGAPKQETWVHQHRHELRTKLALCVGATIDFLAGDKLQAPVWMRRSGLEWAHRVASEPRRLAKRYAKDAWVFPRLVWQEWCSSWKR